MRQLIRPRVQLARSSALALRTPPPPRPASAPPAPRTARGCTRSRGYSAAVAFHSSSTCRRSASGSTSSSRTARSGARLQRLDQPLQRRVHHTRTPARASTGAATCAVSANSSPRSSTDSVSGIVRPLLAVQRLDAFPRLAPPLRAPRPRRAVPIVQQRGEQRRRRRHPAAALRQRQRGMLVPQQLRQQRVRLAAPPPRPLPRPPAIRTGSVLMNSPITRSAPSPPCIRPNSTVPNTTSSRPDSRASTCAHATWHRLAALTPSARARSRSRCARSPRPPARRASSIPRPVSLHIQQPERRRRLLHVSQQLAEERLVLLPAHPQPRLRHEVAERQRRRQLDPPRPADAPAISSCSTSSVRVIARPGDACSSSSSQRPLARSSATHSPQQRRLPHVEPVVPRVDSAPAAARPHRPPPASSSTSSTGSGACRHTTCTGSRQPFPHHRRAQDVVPVDHRLQRRQVRVQPLAAVEARSRIDSRYGSPSCAIR